MAIPKQLYVDPVKNRILELGVAVICLAVFMACFFISMWGEEGLLPYAWHKFGCEIRVFAITFAVTYIGMSLFGRYRNNTLMKDNCKQSADVPGIHEGKQNQTKRSFWSFLCLDSSTNHLDEPETEKIGVDDLETEEVNTGLKKRKPNESIIEAAAKFKDFLKSQDL